MLSVLQVVAAGTLGNVNFVGTIFAPSDAAFATFSTAYPQTAAAILGGTAPGAVMAGKVRPLQPSVLNPTVLQLHWMTAMTHSGALLRITSVVPTESRVCQRSTGQ